MDLQTAAGRFHSNRTKQNHAMVSREPAVVPPEGIDSGCWRSLLVNSSVEETQRLA